jgi:hypothetical protein
MNVIFKPPQILYRGESQRNSHFPRLVMVLATDWLGRWKAPGHMIHNLVTNVIVCFYTFSFPLFLKSVQIPWDDICGKHFKVLAVGIMKFRF